MKRTVILLLAFLLIFTVSAQRKKVAVVLCGGGAKGVAHVGALKVLEEAGIPIDMVVGTSMGAIVGGLYSIGYTSHQLDSMVRQQDWLFLFSNKVIRAEQSFAEKEHSEKYLVSLPFSRKPKDALEGGVISAQNLTNLFSDLTIGYHDSIDFNQLPIPFACVAVDVVSGEEVVFHQGVLATAMRSSMAIPAVFTPVRLGDKVLVDGGLLNNYPVDVARQMGADIVIGIDLKQDPKDAEKLTGATDIIWQIVDFISRDQYEKNVEDTDIHINVDVEGYSSSSFTSSAIDTLIVRGEVAARENEDQLIALKKSLGLPDNYVPVHGPYKFLPSDQKMAVKSITFTGLDENDQKWILRKCKFKQNSELSLDDIHYGLSVLTGSENYSGVNYELLKSQDGYNLHFNLDKKKENSLNFGLRFDSEEIAAVLLNTRLQFDLKVPSQLSVTGRLGKRSYARMDYYMEPWFMKFLNLSYMFQYNDFNVYDHGARTYNNTSKYHFIELGFTELIRQTGKWSAGLHFEHYNYDNILRDRGGDTLHIKPRGYVSYFASWHHDTYDKRNFPTRGGAFTVGASLFTDNFVTYKDGAPFAEVYGNWANVFPLSQRFALIPSVYGRVLIGNNIPYSYQNALGGYGYGRYVPQQMPFAGINYVEFMRNSVMVVQLKARQRFKKNHYLTLAGNFGLHDDNFFDLFSGSTLAGGSIGYGYNSLFGPLEVILNYSNRTEKVGFYLNLGFYF